MIIVKLKGGLGNQLFQYAFGRLVAFNRKERLKLDKDILGERADVYRDYGLDNFNIDAEIANKEEIKKFKYPFGIFSKLWCFLKERIFGIYYIGYEPKLLESRVSYFDGYFQSFKYLDQIRDVLLKEITLVKPLEDKYGELLKKILYLNSASIHIRRGDYIVGNNKKVWQTFGLEYYKEALDVISKKVIDPVFFVFSDDIEWVKENLKIDEAFFVSSPLTKDYEEIILMSKCKHNIIANSSFSFWGAWLNQNPNKNVIAPKKWCNKFIKEYKDLAPKEWIKI